MRRLIKSFQHMRWLTTGSSGSRGSNSSNGNSVPSWQKWINFNSPFHAESDQLNRLRHYFWHVDSRGRLYRRHLAHSSGFNGQLTHPRVVNQILSQVQYNSAVASYNPYYPYLSLRAHEHYFISCQERTPIVFRDLVITKPPLYDGSAVPSSSGSGPEFGTGLECGISICSNDSDTLRSQAAETNSVWRLIYASNENIAFDPSFLRVSNDGRLYHLFRRCLPPIGMPLSVTVSSSGFDSELYGVLDTALSEHLLFHNYIVFDHSAVSSTASGFFCEWEDVTYPILPLPSPPFVYPIPTATTSLIPPPSLSPS